MDVERIFSADQIEVHPDLALILKEYTKAVIKANPEDIVQFSADYFKQKVEESTAAEMAAAAGGGN
jgi:hypothetical protein